MMPEPAEEMIVHNLIEALERLRQDLDRVELWTAALGCFQRPVPAVRAEQPLFAIGQVCVGQVCIGSVGVRRSAPASLIVARTASSSMLPFNPSDLRVRRPPFAAKIVARKPLCRSLLEARESTSIRGQKFAPKTLKNGDLTIS